MCQKTALLVFIVIFPIDLDENESYFSIAFAMIRKGSINCLEIACMISDGFGFGGTQFDADKS